MPLTRLEIIYDALFSLKGFISIKCKVLKGHANKLTRGYCDLKIRPQIRLVYNPCNLSHQRDMR